MRSPPFLARCFAVVAVTAITLQPAGGQAMSLRAVPTTVAETTRPLDARFGVAEGFRNAAVMEDIGAGWERVVLAWDQIQPDGPDDFSWLGRTVPKDAIQAELKRGVTVAGLLQFTPGWAQQDPEHGGRSVPRNIELPFDDPENYFGRFVYETVRYYRGQIDEWIIWNEPDFRPDDAGAGGSYTWLGTDEEFAQLMRVGYLAAKKANPDAVVSFPGTSYWVEELASPRRLPFYQRYLDLVATDPLAPQNNYYHDALSLNLYRAPDDLPRVHALFKDIQAQYGLDKPVWLLELNAMPTDDMEVACAERHAEAPIQTTMEQQAAYAVQAFALAAAVGYERIGFYQMVDADTCAQPAVWGVTRDDGTPRPVAGALKTAVTHFAGYTGAEFVPRERRWPAWSPWPQDPTSYTPSWQVYQVVLHKPNNQRVTVLWNGDGTPLDVQVPVSGVSARLLDRLGNELPLPQEGDSWRLTLPAATARFPLDPPGYYFIGGEPLLLIEEGVDPAATVTVPRLG